MLSLSRAFFPPTTSYLCTDIPSSRRLLCKPFLHATTSFSSSILTQGNLFLENTHTHPERAFAYATGSLLLKGAFHPHTLPTVSISRIPSFPPSPFTVKKKAPGTLLAREAKDDVEQAIINVQHKYRIEKHHTVTPQKSFFFPLSPFQPTVSLIRRCFHPFSVSPGKDVFHTQQ